MKKIIKSLIIGLFLVLTFACGPLRKFTTEYDTHMLNAFEDYYTSAQLDSICLADTISRDLNSWLVIYLRDDETGDDVSQYFYIKSLGEYECIYRVQKYDDNLYKVTKRITR